MLSFIEKFLLTKRARAHQPGDKSKSMLYCEELEPRILLSAPQAVDDVAVTTAGSTVRIDVSENDSSSLLSSVVGFTEPDNGSVTLRDDGAFNYVSDQGFAGADSFTYSIQRVRQGRDLADGFRDNFGGAVDIDGEFAIVGARLSEISSRDAGPDGVAVNSGRAFIYQLVDGRWNEIAALDAPDPQRSEFFGWSVAIDGNNAVVGAVGRDADGNVNSGAAFVYSRNEGGTNNWGLVTTLDNPSPGTSDQFGASVAIDGNTIAIGTPLDDDPSRTGRDHGSVSIFQKNLGGTANWGLRTTIYNSEGDSNDQFGSSIALENAFLVVGSPLFGADSSGAVFVHSRNRGGADAWGLVRQIDNPEPQRGDQFGRQVGISNGVVAVGSPVDDVDDPATPNFEGVNSGSVFLFDRNEGGGSNFGQLARLQADGTVDPRNGESNDLFGQQVSISGDRLFVGASGTSGEFGATGVIYEFQRTGDGQFELVSTIFAEDPTPGQRFGSVLAAQENGELIVGSLLDSLGGEARESVTFINETISTATVTVTVTPAPTDLIVSTLDDIVDDDFSQGNLSLREAIILANRERGHDTITFDETLGVFADGVEDTIALSGSSISITDSLTIIGPSAAGVTIEASSQPVIFSIRGSATPFDVTIDGLTFVGGNIDAASSGALTINNSEFRDSKTSAIRFESVTPDTIGLTVNNSIFEGNSTDDLSSGGFGTRSGGAIHISGRSNNFINDSRFENNTVTRENAEIVNGGAIFSESREGTLTIRGTTIANNVAEHNGGGVYSSASLVIEDSTISDNRTWFGSGGGVFVVGRFGFTTVTVTNSTLSGNRSDDRGGALDVVNASVALTNTTLSDNRADTGGALSVVGGAANSVSIVGASIVRNVAERFGSLSVERGLDFEIHNSLIVGNSDVRRTFSGSSVVESASFALGSRSSNNLINDPDLISDVSHGENGNIIGDGLGNSLGFGRILMPLADNGGSSLTHALVDNSPAIDAGNNDEAEGILLFDQRGDGFGRLVGEAVDIGALERQS